LVQLNRIKKKLFLLSKKLDPANLTNYKAYNDKESVLLKYWDFENNWGDTVNPYLVSKITGRQVISSNRVINYRNKTEVLGIGSIISGDITNYAIWGSGVLSEETKITGKAKKFIALRGYNSLKKLREVGCNCEVFGDPVLLFPDIFPGQGITKNYKYGIIPHFKDKNRRGVRMIAEMSSPDYNIIDIQTGPEEFVRQVLSCETIISSSLHGLILAEAYGIPTCRVIFSENLKRGDFKFYDYYSGVGIKQMQTIVIHDNPADFQKALKACSLKDLSFNSKLLSCSLTDFLENEYNK
jgi:pyruvyltransferase